MATIEQCGSGRMTRPGRIGKSVGDGPGRRAKRYWLIYSSGDAAHRRPLTLDARGAEHLPVFSFREEAELYLALTPRSSHLRVRESDAPEVVSLLEEARPQVSSVVLDPIPEVGGAAFLDLLSVSSEEFVSSALGEVRHR